MVAFLTLLHFQFLYLEPQRNLVLHWPPSSSLVFIRRHLHGRFLWVALAPLNRWENFLRVFFYDH